MPVEVIVSEGPLVKMKLLLKTADEFCFRSWGFESIKDALTVRVLLSLSVYPTQAGVVFAFLSLLACKAVSDKGRDKHQHRASGCSLP